MATKQAVLQQYQKMLFPGRTTRLQEAGIDFVPDWREGYRYRDMDGHELMDLHLNGGTFNLGHRHPELVKALRDASDRYDIGNHHFPSEPKTRLARALLDTMPDTLSNVVFTPSGSEANDLAIKVARRCTGRRNVLCFAAGYHGRSGLSGAAGDDETARAFLSDYPAEFIKVPFNDLEAMTSVIARRDVALVLIEPLPATFGFPLPAPDFLPAVQALCRQHGTLLALDEVQTGLGRSGKPWACQHWDLEPDMLITGKGLSGGLYPMAAVAMNERCASWTQQDGWGYVSTFGGSDLGCMVALKALELSLAPSTLTNVQQQAAFLRAGLDELRQRFPALRSIRQLGLIIGLEFDSATTCKIMVKALYDQGVWAMLAGFDQRVLQFKPGLLVDRSYCSEVLVRLEKALIWHLNHVSDLIMENVPLAPAVRGETESLARQAAAHWLNEPVELSLLKLRENAVYKVTDAAGQSHVLRVHRPGYHSRDAIESELAWMQALRRDGFKVPEVVPTPQGDAVIEHKGHCFSMVSWLDGELFNQLGEVPTGVIAELKSRYHALGSLAGRLHNQGSRWQPPQRFRRPEWDIEGLLGDNPNWGRFWDHPMLSRTQRRLLLKARNVLRILLQQLGQTDDCYGLIHGDLLPENILQHEGELALIDFDDCGYGWFMFEMATSLFPLSAEPYFDELVDAYVSGYRSERHFSDEHLEIFPALLLLRGTTYIGWLMERGATFKHRDELSREIINGICEAIPKLLDELNNAQRFGIALLTRWQELRLPKPTGPAVS
ncbi:aminotransferase class III-fold pyridoxal phosphate-dependent enzyme [Marinobacter sp. F4216]|uniref:aminotransferase class III-fold pyridoxal phosphate-dependent enzyme n=1 Tax=Marinobacter sp. F4216 TaxID=2874281 RepID=UPI001CBD9CDB|nr:aminotransferase class III-fold pyridoxal phosphate-dependent enzyme [Marinobacter sp. F4216]MBZ2167604.1 aminotransferase class III-fold pyridoxal phosphate-dependent enzyme [Marinobacter sp. F4216]